jgi:hypothetical protein
VSSPSEVGNAVGFVRRQACLVALYWWLVVERMKDPTVLWLTPFPFL